MVAKVKFGLIAGTLAGLWLNIQYYTGWYLTGITKFNLLLTLLFLFLGIYFGVTQTRDKEKKGFIDYRPAAGSGIIVALLFSLILALFTYLFYTINPDYIEYLIAESEKYFLQQGKTVDEIAKNSNDLRSNFAISQGLTTFLLFSIIGLLFSLLSAVLLKRENPNKE